MKTKVYRIFLLLVAAFVLAALFFALRYAWVGQASAGNEAAEGYAYLLRVHEGKIGVFRAGESEPFRVLEVYVSTLPVLDQSELSEGVYIQNEEKLQVIIEDYES